MTTTPLSMLDQAELLQLAITSGQRNDAASALSYLKEAVSRDDAGPNAYLLLGAEYAEIGLYDRAISAMEMALQIDPAMALARLQLGLLVLSSGDAVKAETILQPLATNMATGTLPGAAAGADADAGTADAAGHAANDGEALVLFARGLIHLIHDEFDAALENLTQGMSGNAGNLALNRNMQKIIDGINQLPEEVRKQAAANKDESQMRHVLLSAYTDTVH